MSEQDYSEITEEYSDESYIEKIDALKQWNSIIIRDEFLYLYFNILGIEDNLCVEKMESFFEIKRKKHNQNFQFAIVKVKICLDNTENSDEEEEDIKLEKVNDLQKKQIVISYPTEFEIMESEYEDKYKAICFLSLCYSGFFNSYLSDNNSKLYENKWRDKNVMLDYLKKIKSEVDQNKDEYPFEDYNSNFFKLIMNQRFKYEHNKIIEEITQNKLSRILPSNSEMKKQQDTFYSLFFLKDGSLFEFQSWDGTINVISTYSNSANSNEILSDHILRRNQYNQIKYLNDVTIFSEITDAEHRLLETNSGGGIFYIITCILFIINFFSVNPQGIFYNLRSAVFPDGFYQVSDKKIFQNFSDYREISQIESYIVNQLLMDSYTNSDNYDKKIISKSSNSQNVIDNKTNTYYNSNQLKPNGTNIFKSYGNLFCGMQLEFSTPKLITKSSFNQTNLLTPYLKFGYYDSYAVKDDTVNGTDFFLDDNDFTMYFKPNLRNNQLSWYKDQLNVIFNNVQMSDLTITIMNYNFNYNIAINIIIKFTFGSFGTIKILQKSQGFLPFLNEGVDFHVHLFISIIYLIGQIYILFFIIRNFVHSCADLIKRNTYTFEWYDWLDIVVLLLCLYSQFMSFSLILFRSDVFPISINTEDEFIKWTGHFNSMEKYLNITGFAMLCIMIRFIRIFHTNFPSFGIVFQTISVGYREILAYFLIIGFWLCTLNIGYHITYGRYREDALSVQESLLTVFLIYIGAYDTSGIAGGNNNSFIEKYLPIIISFISIINVQIFFAILRNNYWTMKQEREIYNKAVSMIYADSSREFKNNLYNFMICRDPVVCEEENNKTTSVYSSKDENKKLAVSSIIDKSASKTSNLIDIQKNLKNDEQFKNARSSYKQTSLWNRTKYHLKNLNLIGKIFSKDVIWTKEEFQIKITEKYREILKGKFINLLNELERDYDHEFNLLIQFLIFFFYTVIFFITLVLQLKIAESNKLKISINKMWDTLNPYNTPLDWIVVKKLYLDPFINSSYNIQDSDKCEYSHKDNKYFTFITDPYYRLTARLIKYDPNPYPSETQYQKYILSDYSPLTETYCYSKSEFKENLFISRDNLVVKYEYESPGSLLTPDNCGGYVLFLNRTISKYCNNTNYDFENDYMTFSNYFFTENSLGSLVLDSVIFPKYNNFLIYLKISWIRQPLGTIKYFSNFEPIPIHRNNNQEDFHLMIVEWIFIIFTIYFFAKLIDDLCVHIIIRLKKDFYDDPEHDAFEKSSLFNKFFRINFSKHQDDSLLNFFGFLFIKFFDKLRIFIFLMIVGLFDFFKYSPFNILSTALCFTSLNLIIMWNNILQECTSLITILNDPYERINNIQLGSHLHYDFLSYRNYCALNGFLIGIIYLKYLRFSKAIFSFIVSIQKSIEPILYHILLLIIFNFGFILLGYSIFGQNIENFSTLIKSCLSIIMGLVGGLEYAQLTDLNQGLTLIYFFMMFSINHLILFNILAGIVIEGYRDVKNLQIKYQFDLKNYNFFGSVLDIIENKSITFYTRCRLYYYNLKYLNDEVIVCTKLLESILLDLHNVDTQKPNFTNRTKNFIITHKNYIEDVIYKIKNFEKITSEAQFYLPEKMKEEKESKYVMFQKEMNNKAKPTDHISTYTKFFIYIGYLIDPENIFISPTNPKNQLLNLVKTRFNKTKRVFNLNSKTININSKTHIKPLSTKKTWLDFIKDHWKKKDEGKIVLKRNFFEKNKKLQYPNFKSLNEIKRFNQFFNLSSSRTNNIYNTNFYLPCHNYPYCEENSASCSCQKIEKYFKSIAVLTYDLIIKHFYVPKLLRVEDKELMLGYHLLKINENRESEIKTEEFVQVISNHRLKMFENDIKFIKNFNKMKILNFSDLHETEQDKEEEAIWNPDTVIDDLKKLYKFFTIWNTIFMVFYKRNLFHILKLKQESYSFQMYKIFHSKKIENHAGEFDNHYQAIVIKMFNLDKPNENYLTLTEYIKAYVKNQKKIENINFNSYYVNSELLGYEDHDKLLLDDNIFEEPSNILPQDISRELLVKESNKSVILVNLWQSVHQNDKFFLFFGYNNSMTREMNLDSFLKNDFLNESNLNLKINELFTSLHRAELLTILNFPKFFEDKLIEKLKEFIEKNKINDNNKIREVQCGEDVIKYFTEMMLNQVKSYDFMTQIFDFYFKDFKKIVKNLREKFKLIFNQLLLSNSNFFADSQNLFKFVSFYKLFLSKAKFDEIVIYINKIENKNDDEEEEENKNDSQRHLHDDAEVKMSGTQYNSTSITFMKYENFIYATCLDPFEFLDVIKTLDNLYLKEFYMFLFIYMHSDDNDYHNYEKYLKKYYRVQVYDKYIYYNQYLEKREILMKMKDKYDKELNLHYSSLQYMQNLKSSIEKFTNLKNKIIDNLYLKIAHQEDKMKNVTFDT